MLQDGGQGSVQEGDRGVGEGVPQEPPAGLHWPRGHSQERPTLSHWRLAVILYTLLAQTLTNFLLYSEVVFQTYEYLEKLPIIYKTESDTSEYIREFVWVCADSVQIESIVYIVRWSEITVFVKLRFLAGRDSWEQRRFKKTCFPYKKKLVGSTHKQRLSGPKKVPVTK